MDELQTLLTLGTLLSMLVAIASFFLARKKDAVASEADLNERFKELEAKIQEECGEKYHSIDKRLENLETKMEPLWNAIIKEIPKLLISPHTPQLDTLLQKGVSLGWECLEPQEISLLDELIDKEVALLRLFSLKGSHPNSKQAKRNAGFLAAYAVVKVAMKTQVSTTIC